MEETIYIYKRRGLIHQFGELKKQRKKKTLWKKNKGPISAKLGGNKNLGKISQKLLSTNWKVPSKEKRSLEQVEHLLLQDQHSSQVGN